MMKFLLILLTIPIVCISQTSVDTTIGSWHINLTQSESVRIPNYFEDQEKIDSISKGFSNWHRRAIAIEKYQLIKFNAPVKNESPDRIVTLSNGKDLRLTNDGRYESASYTFEKEFREIGLYQFRIQWGEGNGYCLVNKNTGKTLHTIGRAYLSPDKKHLVCINDDLEAEYSPNGFQLINVESLEIEWALYPNWGTEILLWIGRNEFVIKGYILNNVTLNRTETFEKIKFKNER